MRHRPTVNWRGREPVPLTVDAVLKLALILGGVKVAFRVPDESVAILTLRPLNSGNDPLSVTAHWFLGWAFLNADRSDEAIQQLSKVGLDPNSAWARTFLERVMHFESRRGDTPVACVAGWQARATQSRSAPSQATRVSPLRRGRASPSGKMHDTRLGRAYLIKGMQQRAIEELETARRDGPDDVFVLGLLGYGYAVTGRRADALKVLQSFDEMERHRYVSRAARVYVYAGLGDKDKAFEWLEKAYQERSDALAWFRQEPESQSLRTDPRFAALMRKVGFTEP